MSDKFVGAPNTPDSANETDKPRYADKAEYDKYKEFGTGPKPEPAYIGEKVEEEAAAEAPKPEEAPKAPPVAKAVPPKTQA